MKKARIVGIYDSADEANKRLQMLRQANFPHNSVFVTTTRDSAQQNTQLHMVSNQDAMGAGASSGAFWGGVIGILFGFFTFMFIEGGGEYESRFARLIIALLIGVASGALFGIVVGALAGSGAARLLNYRLCQRLFTGKHLVVIRSTRGMAQKARSIVEHSHTPSEVVAGSSA